jgi:Holliday junction DNA helicase RuvA
MIVSLEGLVEKKLDNNIVVDVNGVGYGLTISSVDFSNLRQSEKVKFFIYEYIREQSYDLYGFLDPEAKNLFIKLIEVNGVGPKAAMSILNIGTLEQIIQAISSADFNYIQQANGIGKRVAERIIIELKDKLSITSQVNTQNLANFTSQDDEALQALLAMGYNKREALDLLSGVDKNLAPVDKIRMALKGK